MAAEFWLRVLCRCGTRFANEERRATRASTCIASHPLQCLLQAPTISQECETASNLYICQVNCRPDSPTSFTKSPLILHTSVRVINESTRRLKGGIGWRWLCHEVALSQSHLQPLSCVVSAQLCGRARPHTGCARTRTAPGCAHCPAPPVRYFALRVPRARGRAMCVCAARLARWTG